MSCRPGLHGLAGPKRVVKTSAASTDSELQQLCADSKPKLSQAPRILRALNQRVACASSWQQLYISAWDAVTVSATACEACQGLQDLSTGGVFWIPGQQVTGTINSDFHTSLPSWCKLTDQCTQQCSAWHTDCGMVRPLCCYVLLEQLHI